MAMEIGSFLRLVIVPRALKVLSTALLRTVCLFPVVVHVTWSSFSCHVTIRLFQLSPIL